MKIRVNKRGDIPLTDLDQTVVTTLICVHRCRKKKCI